MLPFALCSLAAVTLDDQGVIFVIIAGALVGFSAFVRNVVGTTKDAREMRSKDPAAGWATREELRQVHGRMDELISTQTASVNKMYGEVLNELKSQRESAEEHRRTLTKDMGAIERSLGRLEGQEKILESHGEAIRDLAKALSAIKGE